MTALQNRLHHTTEVLKKLAVGELPHTFGIALLPCQHEAAFQICCALDDWDPDLVSCKPGSDTDVSSVALGRSLPFVKCVG